MFERVGELQKKEVINISDGKRLGFLYDVEIDLKNGRVGSIIVPGRRKFFAFFRKYEENIISFEQIRKIGDDIILIELD